MSTTVTYKGDTLTTVSNQTRKLLTQGKYLEDDITLVDVSRGSPNLQTKSVSYTPSETAQSQSVTADAGYDGLDEVDVSVGAISSTYVGSDITRRSSTDMTASGATVTAPAGYYESGSSKAVASGSATPPTTISGSQATLTTGTNTITLQKTLSVTPRVTAGYVSTGTADNVLVSLNANVTTQAAQTIYPSATDQSIASGRYLTGAQTIKAVTTSNITAENIKNGVTITVGDSADADRILSVTGTYSGGGGGASNIVEGTFTTGSSAGVTNINIPYTGSGYPISCIVVVEGGAYHSGTDWYNSVQRYAIGQWTMTKAVFGSAPTYGTSGSQNQGVITAIYKNNTSSATSYTRTSAMNTNVYSSNNASNSAVNTIKLKSGNVLSYYVNTSSYGLHPNITYRYIITYSS